MHDMYQTDKYIIDCLLIIKLWPSNRVFLTLQSVSFFLCDEGRSSTRLLNQSQIALFLYKWKEIKGQNSLAVVNMPELAARVNYTCGKH